MKSLIKTLSIVLTLLVSVYSAKAQEAFMPQASSGQTIIQDFGLGKVTLSYSRPNLKGRKMFGQFEPYGEVWRTGANSATSITFTDEVTFGGNKVPAGKYALFTIPGKEEWTIILNKIADQWGAYSYKKDDDLLRFTLKPTYTKAATETFQFQFTHVTPGNMALEMAWENTVITIPMEINFDAKVMANINKAMAGDKKPYFAAAMYYYDNNKDLNKALAWITEAEKTDVKAPYYKLWKARILLKMGNKKAAATTAEEGIALALESKNEEYVRLNKSVLEQAK